MWEVWKVSQEAEVEVPKAYWEELLGSYNLSYHDAKVKHFTIATQLSKPSDNERKSFQMEEISYDESASSEKWDDEACSQL